MTGSIYSLGWADEQKLADAHFTAKTVGLETKRIGQCLVAFPFLLMNQWKSRNNDFDPEFWREISHQQGAAQPHFQQTTINCGKVSINRLLATFKHQGPEILDINEQNAQKAANKRKHGQRREKKRGTGSRWQRPYVHFGCKGGRDFMLRVVAAKVSP